MATKFKNDPGKLDYQIQFPAYAKTCILHGSMFLKSGVSFSWSLLELSMVLIADCYYFLCDLVLFLSVLASSLLKPSDQGVKVTKKSSKNNPKKSRR